MTTKRRWTNDEEQVIIAKVRRHSNNLQRAFKEAAEEIDRTEGAVEFRWYSKLRSTEVVFMTVSAKRKTVNTKNIIQGKQDTSEEVQLSIWRRILRLLSL